MAPLESPHLGLSNGIWVCLCHAYGWTVVKGSAVSVRVRKPPSCLDAEWTEASRARLESLSAPRPKYVLEVPHQGEDNSDMSDANGDDNEGSAEEDADLAEEDGTDANPVEAAHSVPAVPHSTKLTKAEQVKAASVAEEAW